MVNYKNRKQWSFLNSFTMFFALDFSESTFYDDAYLIDADLILLN